MAKAKKLPSGSWRCLAYDYTDTNEKRHYKSFTANTKKEAEYMAAEYALYKKELSCADKTFETALEDYIALREPVVSPRTTMSYKRILKNDLGILRGKKIADITQDIIQNYINEDSKKHSPKTVRDNHGLISAVLKQERPDFALNTVLPKNVRPQMYVPADEDVKILMMHAADTELELPILLAAFGPMRRGEICALDANHINGNVVHVAHNMVKTTNNTWEIKSPKSYAGDRFISYPDFVCAKWQGISGRITLLNPDNITTKFTRLLKATDIPHFRFHDLRHYSASIQHALGVPDAYIMQRGGWGNDGVLKNVYRHAMTGKTEEMNQIANSYFTNMQHEMQHKKIKPL